MTAQTMQIIQASQQGIEAPKKEEKKGMAISGLMAVMLAIADNIPSIQGLSTVLLKASATLTGFSGKFTSDWLSIISTGPNSDEEQIQKAEAIPDVKQRGEKLSALSAQYQQHNLEYQETQTFWTGLNDATQQSSATTADSMNTVINFGQAILTSSTNLTNILA